MLFKRRNDLSKVYERNPEFHWKMIEDRVVVVDHFEPEVVHLNAIASEIWQQLDGNKPLEKIFSEMGERYEVLAPILEKDAAQFIRQLEQRGLIRLKGASEG